MHDTAAALVDRVLVHCPYRQWVITFPRRVRWHLGADPKLAGEALTLCLRVIFAWQRRRARLLGARPSRANSNGAVTMVQRFNSALELSLHYHSIIADGVFVRDGDHPDARPRFVEIDPPTNQEVADLLDRIVERVLAMLRRRGRLGDDVAVDPEDEPQPHLLFAARPTTPPSGGEPDLDDPLPPRCARRDGFSLHAGVAVHQNDRLGLERLARYCLRPPLAAGRLTEAPDGTLIYTMKRRFSDGRHQLRFEPRELLLRLCALVPPRRFHLTRYAGLFASHARGRHALTGRGLHDRPATISTPTTDTPATDTSVTGPPTAAPPTVATSPATPTTPTTSGPPPDVRPAPPDDPERQRRLTWAVLMRRTWGLEVLVCPRCAGPMRLVSAIEDPAVAARILWHLGLPTRAPPRGPPWCAQRPLPFAGRAASPAPRLAVLAPMAP
jgi:hypothetical protein